MSAVSDKARFYLERAVPQLREFEERELFSKEEIRTLVTKRSEFEHRILAPRTRPADFLAYAQWEQSLDALRAKRCRRLQIYPRMSASSSLLSAVPSRARLFAILDRAVVRHPASVELWTAYLAAAEAAGAAKRWRRIAARALRMHPANSDLWASAARRAAAVGDMDAARAYFLRGCRFCAREPTLWVEYARCEMKWLGRIEGKRKGRSKNGGRPMEAVKAAETVDEEDVIAFDDADQDEDDGNEAELMLPDPDADSGSAAAQTANAVFDDASARRLEQSPALNGALPIAIFDVASKQKFFGAAAAEAFFNMIAAPAFDSLSCRERILQHVLDAMEEQFPTHPGTGHCRARRPLVGVSPHTAAFALALREALARLKATMESTEDRAGLAAKTAEWVDGFLEVEGLDDGIKTVLEHTKRRLDAASGGAAAL